WIPSSNGMPNTRVSMLQVRDDKTVLAGTYGRGMFTSTSLVLPTITFGDIPTFITESIEDGRDGSCNGYKDIEIDLILSGAPTAATPVLLKAGTGSTVTDKDYQFLPSPLVLIQPGQADPQRVTLRIFDDGVKESTEFLNLTMEIPIPGLLGILGVANRFISIGESLTEINKIATELGSSDRHLVAGDRTIYFYTETDEVLARFENLSAHDFGCVSLTIDRAGNEAMQFQDPIDGLNDLAAKTFFLQVENPSATAPYKLTLYYSAAEIAGWEAATGKSFATDAKIIHSKGAISRITPGTLTPDGTITRYDTTSTQTVSGGGRHISTVIFGNTGGFGVGSPGEAIAFSGSDLLFDGEALKNSNRLFWDTQGRDWALFEVEKLVTDDSLLLLAKVDGIAGQATYETFDLNPTAGENRYRLNARSPGGDFTQSEIVTIIWEPTPDKLAPVSPNPFTTFLDIFPGDENVAYDLRLIDMQGKLVGSESFVSEGVFTWSLDRYNLSSGVYILELIGPNDDRKLYKLLKR
ncbi:MAG: T9SS type A sorting domain-containing protein, partial [Bacteroidia bacterium]|nr:T9SS type A sorting domain-containing protein [Bacteroidia bacterium]